MKYDTISITEKAQRQEVMTARHFCEFLYDVSSPSFRPVMVRV